MINNYSTNQQLFIDAVLEGKNIFLTGKAGTGKSFIVKEAIRLLQEAKKNIVALAPTGVAANNIGGQTIHSFFSLNPFGVMNYESTNFLKSQKRKLITKIDTIFVDEVSMLRPDVADGMNWTMLKNGCGGLDKKQVIFIGDMKQLPSPIDDMTRSVLFETYNGDTFFYSKIYDKLDVVNIELDEVLRQNNPEFIAALNEIREGKKAEYFRRFVGKDLKGIILAPHNSTVERHNREGLAKVEYPEIVFTAKVEGNAKADEFNLENIITVKNGCKIMYLANSQKAPLVNGTIGTFFETSGCYYIRVDGVDYALEPLQFTKKEYVLNEKLNVLELQEIGSITQYPIRLAYALSIHKSQANGMTIVSGTLRTHHDGKGFREVKTGKGATIPARAREDGSGQNVVSINSQIRRLTPVECERLQTVPDNYTNHVSDTQRYKMLGNGWTVDVISHIFNSLL